MSKGEDKIVDLLNEAHIVFQREKTFSDLKGGKFRYDFYLPYVEGGPVIIEFNGEQHYKMNTRFFKTRAQWMKQQEHDRRKISYCLANKIKIYVIPFWDLDKLQSWKDLFQTKYVAYTRWKNDEDYNKYKRTVVR